MNFPVSRQTAQLISFACIILSLMSMTFSSLGFQITSVLGLISIWTIVISDSFQLSKVQNEMTASMEMLRKQHDSEIQDLLYFLRTSKISASPLETTKSACNFLSKIDFPCFVMSPAMAIIKANKQFTDALGYEKKEIDGWPAVRINNKVVMSEIGAKASQLPYREMNSLHMSYVYIHKLGNNVFGSLDINKLSDGGYFVVFHPEDTSIASSKEIRSMCI